MSLKANFTARPTPIPGGKKGEIFTRWSVGVMVSLSMNNLIME